MRAEFLGSPIDILTKIETVNRAREAMLHKGSTLHVALHVAKLVSMRTDPVLAEDVKNSDLVGIDGMGIVFAARLLGLRIPERVAGIDLLQALLDICETEGFRPFFLGSTPEVVSEAVAGVSIKHPSIDFAGVRDGYFTPEQEADVVREIRESKADCLFIGMPTPRKERFLNAYRSELGVPFIMGVGGSFDVLAGRVKRAPKVMQKFGFEWLYRTYQEPRRLWWRYLKTNSIFAALMLAAVSKTTGRKIRYSLSRTKH